MCGIFGEFHVKPNRMTPEDLFVKLNELNFRRGPDSGGYWTDGAHCQLGYRRLATMDLSEAANQPMYTPNGNWVMLFNGEVYNYSEIKKSLPEGKYQFKTHGDTEVILYAFDHFGPEAAVKMLDGMFAIALYHIKEQKLYLMRDFAGIKPLFYGQRDGSFVFGSQFDQLYHHPLFKQSTIDPSVLKTYLQYHYIPAPLGLITDTHQLLPGEMLTADRNGAVSKHRFWTFPNRNEHPISNEKEALELIDQQLEIAVTSELTSDVPLGTFLSGGIDSPLVAYYAQKKSTSPLKAFSIGSDSALHDESEDATWYAKKIGVDQHLEKMNAGYALSMLDEVLDSLKEPLADFSIIPTFLVSKFARKDLTVALSGDGGDELFYGYERYHSVLKNIPYTPFSMLTKKIIYGYDKLVHNNKNVNDIIFASHWGEAHSELHSRFRKPQVEQIFPDLATSEIPASFNVYQYENSANEAEMLHRMAEAEFYGMMQKTLAKVDRASMANSLEVRVPFLKKQFIEQSLTISPYLSYGKNKKKELLKTLLKNKIENPPINNKKRGFSVPLANWLRSELKTPVWEQITSTDFLQTFGGDKQYIQKLFDDHQQKKVDAKWQLFTLYVLAEWHQRMKKYTL